MRICREKMDNPDLQDLPDKKATEATTGWKDCQVQKVNKVCSDQSDQQGLPAHTVPEVSFDFCSLWPQPGSSGRASIKRSSFLGSPLTRQIDEGANPQSAKLSAAHQQHRRIILNKVWAFIFCYGSDGVLITSQFYGRANPVNDVQWQRSGSGVHHLS